MATLGIVIAGSLLSLAYIVPDGLFSCNAGSCGLRIGEWHYHDALWHIAVARNSFEAFPPLFPSAAGFALTSYNYLLGLILRLLELVHVDPFLAYFQIIPVICVVSLAISLNRYFTRTNKSDLEKLWISFFVYFGSSLSYILIWYKHSAADYSILRGFPVVSTLQPSFLLSNVQFALTLPVIVYVFTDVVSHRALTLRRVILYSFLIFLVVGLKIYSAIFLMILLALHLIVAHVKSRDSFRSILVLGWYGALLTISTLLLYTPSSTGTGLPFLLSPFAIPHVLTESPGLLYHKDFTLGRYYMYGVGKLSLRLIAYEALSTMLFVVWNVGARIILLPFTLYHLIQRRMRFELAILLCLGTLGLIIPVLLIQRSSGWYNSIQFAYVSIYLLSIAAGITAVRLISRYRTFGLVLVSIVVILSIPNTFLTPQLLGKDKIIIPERELTALSYLRTLPDGVVLSFPDDKNSSYVPALSGKVGYMIDYEQAALLNLPVQDRIEFVEDRDCSVLDEVRYLYLATDKGREYLSCPQIDSQYTSVYRYGDVQILQRELR